MHGRCSDRVYERDGSYQARYLEGLEAIGFATVILGATAVLVSMAPNRAHPVDQFAGVGYSAVWHRAGRSLL